MQFRLIVLMASLAACFTTASSFAADKPGCRPPGWAQQRQNGYDLDDCHDRNWATVDLDLQPQPRMVYGHRNIIHFAQTDQSRPSPSAVAMKNFYTQLAQKVGGKLISNPKDINYAVFDARTPKGETVYVWQHYGDDATTSAYELTTLAVLPMPLQGQGQPMKAALDTQGPCLSPPWYTKTFAHYSVDTCDARLWDSLPVDTASGGRTIEGPRTTVSYKLDDEANGIPGVEYQKDFDAIFKQMGATVVSMPANMDMIVATQKTPAGEFWYQVQHYGDNDTTQAFALTTVQIMALPQIVRTQPMKAPLNTQTATCSDPPWLVTGFPQYKRDSCDNLVRDSVAVDLASGPKTIEGPRTAVTYTLTVDKKVETQRALGLSFANAFKAMGATLMSKPDDFNQVVAMQKNPAGEFWFRYAPGSGNDEGAGSYTLTTMQVTAFYQIVKVQPMTGALNFSQVCANPPWLLQQFPQYKLDSCHNFPWDKTTISLASGDKPIEGSKTIVTYTLTDPKQDQTALTVKKNYAEAFKAIGDPPQSDPNRNNTTIATQKNAAGEFWFEYDHGSGNDESTGSYSLTTLNVIPFPQIVQVRAMPQGLDPQTKPPCRDPSWLVKQFSYYKISQCSGRDFDSIAIDLPGGKKTLAGRILVTDYTMSDQTISATPEYVYRNYASALQGIGTQLVSDANDHGKAVWTQKTAQGEFWYLYSDSGGNDESESGYELTSVQVGGPPPKTCTLEVYGVNFDFNKATLRPESEPVLQQVLALFTADPKYAAEIGGHTDNVGTESYNMKLSAARADAVKAWLVGHGVAAQRLTTHGYGDTRPLVPNTTDANRFKNRRVELKRQNCK